MTMVHQTKAEAVKPGQVVDLEGDRYAETADGAEVLAYEYVEVADVERETPDCVRVDFEGFDSIGFPAGHLLKVVDGEAG